MRSSLNCAINQARSVSRSRTPCESCVARTSHLAPCISLLCLFAYRDPNSRAPLRPPQASVPDTAPASTQIMKVLALIALTTLVAGSNAATAAEKVRTHSTPCTPHNTHCTPLNSTTACRSTAPAHMCLAAHLCWRTLAARLRWRTGKLTAAVRACTCARSNSATATPPFDPLPPSPLRPFAPSPHY